MTVTLNHLYPRARRSLLSTVDIDGAPIVLVFMRDGRAAKFDADQFYRLMELGVSPNMSLNDNGSGNIYVRATRSPSHGWHNTAMVARFILPPMIKGVVVRYADNDPLNLRLDNLRLDENMTPATVWERHVLEEAEAASLSV